MEMDASGLEVLDRDECLRLLTQGTVGRIALTSRGLPFIVPVDYRLDGDEIVLRTGLATNLHAALDDAIVAFEVDDFDAVDHSGWSVNVTGRVAKLDAQELASAECAPVTRWAPLGHGSVVAISTEMVSGRRLPRR